MLPLQGGNQVTVSLGDVEIGKVKLLDSSGTNTAAIDALGNLAVNIQNNPVLGAGTNTIGKLGFNQDVNIGSVKVITAPAIQGQYLASAPTLSDTQVSNVLQDVNGNLKATLGTNIAGEDIPNDRQKVVQGPYSYLHIAAGQATTLVKSGVGTLHKIIFNGAATATNVTTIYDNTAASGTVIGIPTCTAVTAPDPVEYNITFSVGLTINTATANGSDMTVIYS